ncbi:MAG: flagellar assembly protein FliW [Lachnospiraceae bacterium]
MKAETRIFGTIDIPEEKIIRLETGMIGFPQLRNFALIYDEEKGDRAAIRWLQSMDEPEIAFPVMDPLVIKEDYNPTVSDEILSPLGELKDENTYLLVTVTVPTEIEKLSINLKAPIVINTDNNKGVQLIVEDDYSVKYYIYDLLKNRKAGE